MTLIGRKNVHKEVSYPFVASDILFEFASEVFPAGEIIFECAQNCNRLGDPSSPDDCQEHIWKRL